MIQNQFAVPGKIDIQLLLSSNGYSNTYINNHIDKYHYFLHAITEKRVFNKSIQADDFVCLHTDILRSVLGMPYADEVRANLTTWGVVESDNHYVVGSKSVGYRIAPKYSGKAVWRAVHKSAKWEKKLAKLTVSYQQKTGNGAKTLLDLKRINIDQQEAIQHIVQRHYEITDFIDSHEATLSTITKVTLYTPFLFSFLASFCSSPLSTCLMSYELLVKRLKTTKNKALTAYQILTRSADNSFSTDLVAINKIANKQFFIQQPDSASRVYTNISNLSSDLRRFLLYGKGRKQLVNLDIRNSQPYLFGILLAEHFAGRELPIDVKHYIELTAKGKLYEYMMNALCIDVRNRKSFKIKFFASLFFCTNHYAARTQAGKYFKQAFPSVYKVIELYKGVNYKNLAILMQRKEADVMLNVIQKQVQMLGIWNISIHDSLIVFEEYSETVRNIMREAFTAAVGVPPTIEADILTVGAETTSRENHLEDLVAAEWLGSVLMLLDAETEVEASL
jgi:hypothetical protein